MVEHLTKESFKAKVFDFEQNKDWKFEGNKPCLVDFYADWCGPCKTIAPILEELKAEYGDSLNIYKIDTEKEQELSAMFGIQSIPSLLFIPQDGQPQMAQRSFVEDSFKQAFSEVLGVKEK